MGPYDAGYNLYCAMRMLTPHNSPYSGLDVVEQLPISKMYRYAYYEKRLRQDSQSKSKDHTEAKQ